MNERFTVAENKKLEELYSGWDLNEYEKFLDTLYMKYGIYGIAGSPRQDESGSLVSGVHNLSQKEQLELATRFGEGSNELRDLLLELWKLGIETYSACSGITNEHRNSPSEYNVPFIVVNVTNENRAIIEKFVTELKQSESFNSGCVTIHQSKSGDSVAFRKRLTSSESDAFFHVFREALGKIKT